MFCLMDLTCLGCHLLWYFKGFGILVVVRGVVHRVFKVSVYQGMCFGMDTTLECNAGLTVMCSVMDAACRD